MRQRLSRAARFFQARERWHWGDSPSRVAQSCTRSRVRCVSHPVCPASRALTCSNSIDATVAADVLSSCNHKPQLGDNCRGCCKLAGPDPSPAPIPKRLGDAAAPNLRPRRSGLFYGRNVPSHSLLAHAATKANPQSGASWPRRQRKVSAKARRNWLF